MSVRVKWVFWQIFNFDRELKAFYIYLQFGIDYIYLHFVICNWFWLRFIMIWKSIRPWISSNPVCRTISNQISKDFDRDWSIFQQFTSILQMIILNTVTKFDRESIYNVLHLFATRNWLNSKFNIHLFVIRIDWFWLEFIMVWKSVSPWISSAPACRAIFNLTISKYFDRDWYIFPQFVYFTNDLFG